MDCTLKAAGLDEIPQLLPMVEAFHGFQDLPFNHRRVTEILRHLVTSDLLGRIWLIQLDSETVGFIIICFGYGIESGGRDAFVDELFIQEDFRGQGIGRRVLQMVKERARKLKVQTLFLEVDRHNLRAQQLYLSAGFTPRERFVLMSTDLK